LDVARLSAYERFRRLTLRSATEFSQRENCHLLPVHRWLLQRRRRCIFVECSLKIPKLRQERHLPYAAPTELEIILRMILQRFRP